MVDKLLLLALDDKKGTFVSGPFALAYGFAGAILLELSLKDRIKIVNKKVVVNNLKRTDYSLLDGYLELLINSEKALLNIGCKSLGIKNNRLKKKFLTS